MMSRKLTKQKSYIKKSLYQNKFKFSLKKL